MRTDGTDRRRLTDGRAAGVSSYDAAWSPDGRSIAFASDRAATDPAQSPGDIWVMGADGSGARQLTFGPADDFDPAWGNGPASIAFVRVEDQRFGIHVMDANGGGQRRVTGDLAAVTPAWSPDGRTIAFTVLDIGSEGFRGAAVHVVNADGIAQRRLADDAAAPTWSPDGTRIAFESTRDRNGRSCFESCFPNSEIYVMNADGSGQGRLTRSSGDDRAPSWSPDGRRIVFQSDRRSAGQELYAIAPDGSCEVRVTAGAMRALGPVWRPGTGSDTLPCGQALPGYDFADLEAARAWSAFPLLHLGLSFHGRGLTSADRLGRRAFGFIYEECRRGSERRCAPALQLQLTTVCERNPLRYDGIRASRRFTSRGALVAVYGRDTADIHVGGVTIAVFAPPVDEALLRRVVAALRPVSGAARLGRSLSPPVFPRAMLRRLRETEAAVRRLGIEGARRRLGISRSALRDRVRLARTLRTLPRPSARERRAARC